MATTYKLTWRKEGRWLKRYKGGYFYFAAPEGKMASYARCWSEWLKKKAELDGRAYDDDPNVRAWRALIAKVSHMLAEFSAEDTRENRRLWSEYHAQLCTYEYLIQEGVPYPFLNEDEKSADPTTLPLVMGGGSNLGDDSSPPPPWESVPVIAVEETKTVQGNVDRFLRRKRLQTERGQLSFGRYDSLRVSLETFVQHVGGSTAIASLNGKELSSYRDKIEQQIDKKAFTAYTGRDRLAAVKQFIRWAWGEELMGLPRILESRDFAIAVGETTIETFTDLEIGRMLDASSPSTKLYLLLMLNCGMTQGDIADLLQEEVDWKQGRITRKRSKTRKRNAENVPSVRYQLWPETFELLKQHRSKHKTLALTNQKGQPLKLEEIVNSRVKKIDNVRSAFNRVIKKLAHAKPTPIKITKPLKLMRKTAATKLGSSREFGRFAQYFLGHAPSTVADRHYVAPSQEQFDAAIEWLGDRFRERPDIEAPAPPRRRPR